MQLLPRASSSFGVLFQMTRETPSLPLYLVFLFANVNFTVFGFIRRELKAEKEVEPVGGSGGGSF